MKVFLDTNVLASAFGTRGLCADVVRETLATHELICCRIVLDELRRALERKFRVPAALVAETLAYVVESSTMAPPGAPLRLKSIEPADAEILAAALSAECAVFVTGDQALLELKRLDRMRLVNPRGFWELTHRRAGG